MVIKKFENHTLFCKNELYKKMDEIERWIKRCSAKSQEQGRIIRRSDQLIRN